MARGSIKKRGKSWHVMVDTGVDPATGKRQRETFTTRTKVEAENRLNDILKAVTDGAYIKPGRDTLAAYLERWLSDYAKSSLSPRGFERYRDIIRKHIIPDMGALTLSQVRPEHLQKHYTSKLNAGLSARTVRYHHAVLHVALQTATKWGLVARNVADAVDPPKARRTEMKTWDADEVARFVEGAKDSPYYAMFYTALFTGMRRSELLALAWREVDLAFGQLSVTRGLHHLKDGSYVFTEPKSARSRRTIALPPSVSLLLKEHKERRSLECALRGTVLKDEALVFGDCEGKPIRPNTVTRAWATLAAHLGLKTIRLHDARHTHASLMLREGVHPKIVQERLGHSSIAITLDVYSHVAPGLQEAAAMSFDRLVAPKRETEPVG